MNMLKVQKLNEEAVLPTRAHEDDCGLDVYSLVDGCVGPGDGVMFQTGIAIEIEPGHVGMLADRSSMAKKGFKVAGGIIDPQYRGEMTVVLRNISNRPLTVNKGDRIAQLLVIPILLPTVMQVGRLTETKRGTGGFGSTGA